MATAAAMAVTLAGQSRPQFEVASIRASPDQPPAQGVQAGVQITKEQARFSYLSMKDYIGIAFGVRIHQIVGPDWLGNVRFEVAATLPEKHTPAELPVMLRSLLEDRFQLRTHRESREFAVYALEVGPEGSKLVRVPDAVPTDEPFVVRSGGSAGGVVVDLGQGSTLTLGNNRFDAKKVTMMTLTDTLARFVDRPVVDATKLEGRYDVAFDLTPEDFQAMMMRSAVAAGVALPPQALRLLENASLAAVPDALKTLGLRLESRRAPLEVVVIDGVERTPTEN